MWSGSLETAKFSSAVAVVFVRKFVGDRYAIATSGRLVLAADTMDDFDAFDVELNTLFHKHTKLFSHHLLMWIFKQNELSKTMRPLKARHW